MNILACMKKPHLLNLTKTGVKSSQQQPQDEAGFTLLELLVVVVLIGVIAAITGPTWAAFVNRQRVNKVNDAVLVAIQEAQREAKRTKRSYSVSFNTPNGEVPQVAIYSRGSTPKWLPLTQDLDIKPSQITLGTNLDGENKTQANVDYRQDSPIPTITFDYQGNLFNTKTANFFVVVAVPQPNSDTGEPVNATRRCVKIQTFLGSMLSGKGDECNPPTTPPA